MRINIGKGLTFPTADPNGVTKFIVGSVFSFFSFLLLPVFISMGYYMETVRQASEGEDRMLPDWSRWGEYGLAGFKGFLISLVYMLPAIAIAVIGGFSSLVAVMGGARQESAGLAVAGTGALLASFGAAGLVGIICTFILPMVMVRFARSGRMGDAFNVGGIFADIMVAPLDYLITWGVPIGLSIVGNVVLGMTGVGLFLTPAFTFYVAMVNAHLFGQYYRSHLTDR